LLRRTRNDVAVPVLLDASQPVLSKKVARVAAPRSSIRRYQASVKGRFHNTAFHLSKIKPFNLSGLSFTWKR